MNHDPRENDACKDLDFFFHNVLIPLMSFVTLDIISLFSHFLSVEKEKEQKTLCV